MWVCCYRGGRSDDSSWRRKETKTRLEPAIAPLYGITSLAASIIRICSEAERLPTTRGDGISRGKWGEQFTRGWASMARVRRRALLRRDKNSGVMSGVATSATVPEDIGVIYATATSTNQQTTNYLENDSLCY